MDNPATESGPLDVNQAAVAFGSLLTNEPAEDPPVDTEIDSPKAEEPPEVEVPESEQLITVKIDGKDVQLTQEQIADAYKNGLRQADYTKKTMEAAELRKSAQAETAKAAQERQVYAQNLQRMAGQLEAVLGEQQKIDWTALAKSDPAEWVVQRDLYDQRQTAYQSTMKQWGELQAVQKAEQAKEMAAFLQTEQQTLLAKLPAWKDESKAKAEREALKTYLKDEGYDDQAIAGISDHKAVILARKAMLYDQMLAKASAATKKVVNLPQKVERPGVADSANMDKRTASYQRLSKSGKVEDAAALFSQIL